MKNENFKTRFVVASKAKGCSNCNNLNSFLEFGLNGEFDSQITKFTEEDNKEVYDDIVDFTKRMTLPIILDTETGNHIGGFEPPKIVELLRG